MENANPQQVPAKPESELIGIKEVGEICGMSRGMIWKLYCKKLTPESIKIGRLRRWKRQEILAWIRSGCPSQNKWNSIRK